MTMKMKNTLILTHQIIKTMLNKMIYLEDKVQINNQRKRAKVMITVVTNLQEMTIDSWT